MTSRNPLIEKIEQFIRKYYLNRLIQGVLIGAVLWMVFFLLLNGLEYFSWFSSKIRFVLLLVFLSVSIFILIRHFVIPIYNLIRYRKKMSIEKAAVLIGQFFPDIQDKLLNTVQLTTSSSSRPDDALLLASIEQRTQQLSPIHFTDAVDLKANTRVFLLFLPLLILIIVLALSLPNFAVQPVQRIIHYDQEFDKPLPFSVAISQVPFETSQGKDFLLNIQVTGEHIPDQFYIVSNSSRQLMNRQSINEFSHTFKTLYQDVDFQIVGGDYHSQLLHITVHPQPVLLSYQCFANYPAYIHRENEYFNGKTRIMIPQGTVLDFEFDLRDCDTAYIVLDSLLFPLTILDQQCHFNSKQYSSHFSSSTSFDFYYSNPWTTDIDPLHFIIDVIPDAFPDIRVESYDEALSTNIYYTGLLADDYGFSKLTFNATISNPNEKQIVLPIAFDASSARTTFFYHFNMDSLGMQPGQDIEVYFEIWDNDGFHGPKSKRSETFTYNKPSLAALDSIANQSESDILDRLSDKSDEASKLKDEIEKMLQELTSKKELDWSDKEKLQQLLEKQQEVQDEWNKLQEEQIQLTDFMKDNSLSNDDLLKKQEQINKLFDEIIPDEMKQMMDELQKMLDEMPREKMQQMLQDMKKNNQKMQDLLDRNLSLLEQLKMEKDINDLMDKLNQLGEKLQQTEDPLSADDAKQQFEQMMQKLDSLQDKNKTLSDPFNIQIDDELEQSIEDDLEQASQLEESEPNDESDTTDDSQAGDDTSDNPSSSDDSSQPNKQKSSQKKQEAGQKMQQMANSMQMQMQSSDDEQLAEDAHLVRILLENVVRSSHQEEGLMTSLSHIRTDDPSLSQKIQTQKEISDNFVMVHDSLRAMALRQPMIQNFIFDELSSIDFQTNTSMKHLSDLHISSCIGSHQMALKSMNNLALMLAESLQNMENSMEGSGMSTNKQNKSGKPQSQSMKNMKQMQEQLGEQLKQMQQQMQNGQLPSSQMSEELARMAAEQQMIREGMKQMLDEMKSSGQIGDDGLNQIMKDMERLEEEIVNKKITNQTLERNRQILSRMLESEKAQQKRDQDEKRKSNEYKGSQFDRQVDELLYKQMMNKNQDFLKSSPIQYQPYYRSRINDFYMKKNAQP